MEAKDFDKAEEINKVQEMIKPLEKNFTKAAAVVVLDDLKKELEPLVKVTRARNLEP